MAKKKVGEEDSFFQDLASKTGGDIVANIDSVKYFVDAGNLAVNYICSGRFMGGGIPGGKLTEIYGPSSSSKSSSPVIVVSLFLFDLVPSCVRSQSSCGAICVRSTSSSLSLPRNERS